MTRDRQFAVASVRVYADAITLAKKKLRLRSATTNSTASNPETSHLIKPDAAAAAAAIDYIRVRGPAGLQRNPYWNSFKVKSPANATLCNMFWKCSFSRLISSMSMPLRQAPFLHQ